MIGLGFSRAANITETLCFDKHEIDLSQRVVSLSDRENSFAAHTDDSRLARTASHAGRCKLEGPGVHSAKLAKSRSSRDTSQRRTADEELKLARVSIVMRAIIVAGVGFLVWACAGFAAVCNRR